MSAEYDVYVGRGLSDILITTKMSEKFGRKYVNGYDYSKKEFTYISVIRGIRL